MDIYEYKFIRFGVPNYKRSSWDQFSSVPSVNINEQTRIINEEAQQGWEMYQYMMAVPSMVAHGPDCAWFRRKIVAAENES